MGAASPMVRCLGLSIRLEPSASSPGGETGKLEQVRGYQFMQVVILLVSLYSEVEAEVKIGVANHLNYVWTSVPRQPRPGTKPSPRGCSASAVEPFTRASRTSICTRRTVVRTEGRAATAGTENREDLRHSSRGDGRLRRMPDLGGGLRF